MPNYQHMHFATAGREPEPPMPAPAPRPEEPAEVSESVAAVQQPPVPENVPPTILGVPVATPADPNAPPSI